MKLRHVLLAAIVAAVLGAVAGLMSNGAGPLSRTRWGQRALQTVVDARAPAPPAEIAVAKRGQPVPTFALQALDGSAITLPDAYAGRPVLINLWASWCGPCIEEMPELQRYSAAQGTQGVQVVGVALDDAAAVRAFLQRVPVHYPILLDAPGPADAGVRLGNTAGLLPYSVLLDAEGRLLERRIGPFEHGTLEGFVTTAMR